MSPYAWKPHSLPSYLRALRRIVAGTVRPLPGACYGQLRAFRFKFVFMRGNDAELIGLFGISLYVAEGRLWTI